MKDILVVYWSSTNNTEIMAEKIASEIDADLFSIFDISPEDAVKYDKIAFGCPSMGDTLEDGDEFFEWYEQVEPFLDGKKIALFGSFGWDEYAWMEDWLERLENYSIELFEEPFKTNDGPTNAEEDALVEFGKRFEMF